MKAAPPALAVEHRATRPTCPRCESLEVVPLVFGLPTPELSEYAETTGKVALGGCVNLLGLSSLDLSRLRPRVFLRAVTDPPMDSTSVRTM